MTDRIKGFTVVLDRDYRDDDADVIKSAIEMVKGVLSVGPSVVTPDDWINRSRIRLELREKLLEAVWPKDEL